MRKKKLLLILSFLSVATFAQNLSSEPNSNDIDTLCSQIALDGVIKSSAVGVAGLPSKQYNRFIKLTFIASDTVLYQLTKHESPVVRGYAYWGLSSKNHSLYVTALTEGVNDTTRVKTLFGCIMDSISVIDFAVSCSDFGARLNRKYYTKSERKTIKNIFKERGGFINYDPGNRAQPYAEVSSSQKSVADLLTVACNEVDTSKYLSENSHVKRIIAFGSDSIPALMGIFKDKSSASIYSDCIGLELNRGEVAIIIADLIDGMPYFLVTGIQNCTMEYCPDSPNNIESFFVAINRDGKANFCERHADWFFAKPHQKYLIQKKENK